MASPILHTQFAGSESAQRSPDSSSAKGSVKEIAVTTYNLHDILKGNAGKVTIDTLQYLVKSQAHLHHVEPLENKEKLRRILRTRESTIRGFVLNAEGLGPVGYAIYYPAIDQQGRKVAYCEDFFIAEYARGYGVVNILFHELAKRTLDDGCNYLMWSTDKRNKSVHAIAKNKLKAVHPDQVTIDASTIIDAPALMPAWNKATGLVTRPIQSNDVNLVGAVGINSTDLIRHAGELPFKGFITLDTENGNAPVAVTPGWLRFSTFQLYHHFHLEQPTVSPNTERNQESILRSVIHGAASFAHSKRHKKLLWHAVPGTKLADLLSGDLKLPADSMAGTPESELLVYTLSNGSLKALAESTPRRSIVIKSDDPIGARQSTNGNGKPPALTT